jgi:phenylalanyl-tRNA synthetase beta chain
MSTDAAHRFERGVDWQGQARAIERATGLMIEIAGGEPGPTTETIREAELPVQKTVELRSARISLVLGVDIDDEIVDGILDRLGFQADREMIGDATGWIVSAPSHRFDISIEADLIEEISRVYGYNNLPTRTPVASLTMSKRPEGLLSLNRLRDQLVARGYFEAISYSFVDEKLQRSLDPANEPIELANPLSAEMSVMRTTIWTGLIKALIYNVNRQQSRVRLFETGLCFTRSPNQEDLTFNNIHQVKKLAGIACGPRQAENWSNDSQTIDFYDIKGDVESLLALSGEPGQFQFTAGQHPALHAGQSAVISKQGKPVGYIGLLDPRIQHNLDVRYPIFLFEIEVEAITAKKIAISAPMSRFPEVRRDIAVIVDQVVTSAQLNACVRGVANDTLKNLKLFDVYQGKGIDPNRKSFALGLTFQQASRTLTDEEINKSIGEIVASLEATLGAILRD